VQAIKIVDFLADPVRLLLAIRALDREAMLLSIDARILPLSVLDPGPCAL